MTNNMASSGLWEMLCLPELYLPQMAPMNVQRETRAKDGFGTLWDRAFLTSVFVGVVQAVWPSTPCVALRVWPIVGGQLRGCYLGWRAGMFSRTSSQMWGSWNLPTFQLRDGPLTLMYIACLMILVVLYLLAHYVEIVHTDVMPRGVTMVIDGVRVPEVFFEPFPKSPCRVPFVFLIAIHLVTLVPVDYPTFLSDIIPVFGGNKEVPGGVISIEMNLDPCLTTDILKAFTKPFGVWDHHVKVPVVVGVAVG